MESYLGARGKDWFGNQAVYIKETQIDAVYRKRLPLACMYKFKSKEIEKDVAEAAWRSEGFGNIFFVFMKADPAPYQRQR